MTESKLNHEELHNINSMFNTIHQDFLLPCSKVQANSKDNLASLAEFQAKEFENTNVFPRGGWDEHNNRHRMAHNNSRAKKNVSFAVHPNNSNQMQPEVEKMGEDEQMDDEMSQMFEESRIEQNAQQQQASFEFSNLMRSPTQPQGQPQPHNSSHLHNSQLLQDPFNENPAIRFQMTVDDRVYECLMLHLRTKGQSGPEMQDLDIFKEKINSRRSQQEILTMYKDQQASKWEESQSQQQNSESQLEEQNSKLFGDDDTCQICLDPQWQGNFEDMPFQEEAISLNCMHKVHKCCIINMCIKHESDDPVRCFSCRVFIIQEDFNVLEQQVISHYSASSLLDFINYHKQNGTTLNRN